MSLRVCLNYDCTAACNSFFIDLTCWFRDAEGKMKVTRTSLLLLTAMLLPLCTSSGQQQSRAPVTLVKAGRLLDPRTGGVLSPAAVLVEGERIKQVGIPSRVNAPSGTKILDLGNATLLPGLIDSHTHLFGRRLPRRRTTRPRARIR